MRKRLTMYTANQALACLKAWDCAELLPAKEKKPVVCFSAQPDWEVDLVEVEYSSQRSEYGKRLYRLSFSSKLGRALDGSILEAHVLAAREFIRETKRLAGIAWHRAMDALCT